MDEFHCDDYNYILKYCYKIELEKNIWVVGSYGEFNAIINTNLKLVDHLNCSLCKKKIYHIKSNLYFVNTVCIDCNIIIFRCLNFDNICKVKKDEKYFSYGNCNNCAQKKYCDFINEHMYLDTEIKNDILNNIYKKHTSNYNINSIFY